MTSSGSRNVRALIIVGIALAPVWWVFDTYIDTHFFTGEGFVESLFHPTANEVWMRGFVAAMALGYTCYASVVSRSLEKARAAAVEQVAERRKLENERGVLADRLESVLDSTCEGIVATDREARCTLINRAALRLLERDEASSIGGSLHALLHGPSAGHAEDACPLHAAVRRGIVHSSDEETFQAANGCSLSAQFAMSPIGGNGAVVTFTDITDRRALEKKVELSRRLSSLGHIAAGIAHEFNNVLMSIQPFAELLHRGRPGMDVQSSAAHILDAVRRGRGTTGEILSFVRPIELALEPFSLREWIDSIAGEIRALLQGHEIVIELPEEPVWIMGDRSHLAQVLINLGANARDAMQRPGTLTIRAEDSTVRSAGGGGYVRLTVRDTGHGITEEVLPYIFEPLFTTKRTRGTGLGLALAHRIVTRHDGELTVESTPGTGTAFSMLLPLASPPPKTLVPTAREVPAVGIRNVLLVEDEESVAEGIRALLDLNGIEVTVAGTGASALELLDTGCYDAIVLDIGLPDISGTDLYPRVVQLQPDMPVIFSSGHADTAELSRLGGGRRRVAVLQKPYDADDLIAALSHVETQVELVH